MSPDAGSLAVNFAHTVSAITEIRATCDLHVGIFHV